MEKPPQDSQKDKRFELLRELLLEDDREKFDALSQEVLMQDKMAARVTPIIDGKIENLREKFPEYFGRTITKTIKYQIKESQDEMVDALYPIMGKLVKKAIISEINKLSDRINESVQNTFSFKGVSEWFKKRVSGVNEGDMVLQDIFKPIIEEVFVIEKDSGLLLGNHSTGNIADKDMISGMLTAIKSFAEDAFSKEGQDLENIKFETFQISLREFKSIYIAIAMSGVPDLEFKDKLTDNIFDLAEAILRDRSYFKDELKMNNLIKKHLIEEKE